MSSTRTALESLPSHDGRQYLLFDYAAASTQWPDQPDIAQCLAHYIKSVSDTNRSRGGDGMVYLLAHSMGGLAIRFALDPRYGGIPGLADDVGGVVSLDTPYRGAMWGDSLLAWGASVLNQFGHAMFPSGNSSAWRCLAGGPRLDWPAGCAVPPALPTQVPLYQIGGDVTVRRTFFGIHAYDIDLGGDGIVDDTSQWGSVGDDGKVVATQSGTTAVDCTVDSADFPLGPVGFWEDLRSDGFLIDLYQGKHSPNDPRVLETLKTVLTILLAAPCSHGNMPDDMAALTVVDSQLADMIRHQAGLTKVADLLDAPVPPSCHHPAGTLQGYKRDWGTNQDGSYAGTTSLDTKLAVFGDVTGDGRSDAVVPMDCDAGGVSWPEYLLVYGPGTRLEGWYNLGQITDAQEHEDVDSMTYRDGSVDVAFRSYEGAGSSMATYQGRLTAPATRVDFSTDGPLTVDYSLDRRLQGGETFGPGVVSNLHNSSIWLDPLPTDFQRFLEGEWSKLNAESAGCPMSPTITVSRYSHLGFAMGDENTCGGAVFIWYRGTQGWQVLTGYQDEPYCDQVDKRPTLERALSVLGQSCYSLPSGARHQLGHWPESGE
jgi:hypothetical protein